jgi:hypothetical protein
LVFLGFSDAPFPLLFVQCLAQDVADMAELREELTQVRVTAIMVEARAARLDEVARKVSLLRGELAVACQACDTAEAKLLGLVDT